MEISLGLFPTTCWLVTISPSSLIIKPEPILVLSRSIRSPKKNRKNSSCGLSLICTGGCHNTHHGTAGPFNRSRYGIISVIVNLFDVLFNFLRHRLQNGLSTAILEPFGSLPGIFFTAIGG